MKRYLFLAGVLLLSAGAGKAQAPPSKVHAVGVCNPQTIQSVIHLFEAQESAPKFELYIFCQASDWREFLTHFNYSLATIAFTDWKHGKIYLGPKNLDDVVNLRQTVTHELEHLRCACLLGE